MVKKLVKHGNSFALVLDKPLLDLLKIREDTPLEISTDDGRTLKISPVSDDDRRKRSKSAFDDTAKRFSKTLKNLAK